VTPKPKWYESNSNRTAIITGVLNIVGTILGYPVPEWANIALLTIWGVFMRIGVAKSGPQE